jgi:hypothetical protein
MPATTDKANEGGNNSFHDSFLHLESDADNTVVDVIDGGLNDPVP